MRALLLDHAKSFRAGNRRLLGPSGLATAKSQWKRWGAKPPPFPIGFAVGGGRLDPTKSTISGAESPMHNFFTGRFLSTKHSHRNTYFSIGSGGYETRPETQRKRPNTTKNQRNSRTLPRSRGFLYQRSHRTFS